MKKLLIPSIALAIALSMQASPSSAQSFLGDGGINMGPNGATGVFNGGMVGPGGASANFSTGVIGNGGVPGASSTNFNFDMGGAGGGPFSGSPDQGITSGAIGPGGQRVQGYGNGIGSYGNAYSSQAVMGDRSHQSGRTNTNYQGNTGRTRQNNNTLYETTRYNLLSNGSFDLSGVPSGSYKYGFKNGSGLANGGMQLLRRGWILPPTSTSSVDLNTVSP